MFFGALFLCWHKHDKMECFDQLLGARSTQKLFKIHNSCKAEGTKNVQLEKNNEWWKYFPTNNSSPPATETQRQETCHYPSTGHRNGWKVIEANHSCWPSNITCTFTICVMPNTFWNNATIYRQSSIFLLLTIGTSLVI